MRVLLVEDDGSAAQFISKGLREASYAVDVARDGARASALCTDNEYDAIVLDVMLPKKDGLAVCRELRAAGADVPILMLTARLVGALTVFCAGILWLDWRGLLRE